MENYISNIENCFGNPQESSELTVSMVYSQLKQCDNCQDFILFQENIAFVKISRIFSMTLFLVF